MRRRGRPILGAFSGFFFGFFLALTLLFFGVIALDSPLLWILPLAFLVIVPLIAWWSPFGAPEKESSAAQPAEVPITPVDSGMPPADTTAPTGAAPPPVEPDAPGTSAGDEPSV